MAGGGCGVAPPKPQAGGTRGKSLVKENVDTLYKKAQRYNIRGRSTMNKAQLVKAIRDKQQEIGKVISRRGKK